MEKFCDRWDAEVLGTRDLESAKQGRLSPGTPAFEQRILDLNTIYMEAVAKGDKELLEAITVKLTEAGMFDKARRFVRSNVLGNARTAIQLAKHDDLAQSHKDIEDAHGEPNTASGRHERAAGRTQKAWNKAHLGEEGGRWVYDNAGNMREIPASQAAATRKANLDRMKAASNPFDDDEYGNHQKRQPDEYGNVFNEEETLDEVKSGEIANHPWIARRAKIKGTNEVGEVIRLCREHTFSQMVPFKRGPSKECANL
jgi:hypothetical protein